VATHLLDKYKPDIVLHIGLAVERSYFAVEKGAQKEGYHQYPDVLRKVFTKAETKKIWGKSPGRLDSSLDIDDVAARWAKFTPKGTDVRLSDDVGNYVCGFVYYTSLEYFNRVDQRNRPVIFLHVPPLDGQDEIKKGRQVVLALIRAVVESQRR
jgi:pyroglutamyl-peptidase